MSNYSITITLDNKEFELLNGVVSQKDSFLDGDGNYVPEQIVSYYDMVKTCADMLMSKYIGIMTKNNHPVPNLTEDGMKEYIKLEKLGKKLRDEDATSSSPLKLISSDFSDHLLGWLYSNPSLTLNDYEKKFGAILLAKAPKKKR